MNNLTRAAVLAVALSSAATSAAFADGAHRGHDRAWQTTTGQFGHHVKHYDHQEERNITIRVNQAVHDGTLPLRHLLGLDGQYRNHEVRRVVVTLDPRHRARRLSLIAGGHVIDSEPAHRERRVVLTLDGGRPLGHDLRHLQLAVSGRAYIESISVRLAAPRHRGHGDPGFHSGYRQHERAEASGHLGERRPCDGRAAEIGRVAMAQDRH